MADCLNGGAEKQFHTLDMAEPMHAAPATSSGAKAQTSGRLPLWAIVYMVLVTAIAITALVLGSYSTNKVNNISYPSPSQALLTSDPSDVPAGYSVYSLGTGLGYWSPAKDMMFPRSDHGVVSYGKYAFLIGGVNATNETVNGTSVPKRNVLKYVVKYDTETGVLTQMQDLPQARTRFAYALLGDFIYVMGGTDTDGVIKAPIKDEVFVYDITTNSWSTPFQLAVPRVDACGAAIDGKVYVFGGYDEDSVALSSTEWYSPAMASPSDKGGFQLLPSSSNLNVPRGDCRAVAVEGAIYAVGGAQNIPGCKADNWVECYRFLNSVEAFNPSTRTWSQRAPMVNPRGDFGIESLPGGRIIVAGGERGNGTTNFMAMYDVEEYLVNDNVWVQKAPLPEARFRMDLGSSKGHVYVFGGAPTCDYGEPGSGSDCFAVGLKTVFTYYDIQYPHLYAYYKPATTK